MAETQVTHVWEIKYWELGDAHAVVQVEAETKEAALAHVKAHDEFMFGQLDTITLVK